MSFKAIPGSRAARNVALLIALFAAVATASADDVPKKGDVSGDGDTNVQDVALVVSHLQGTSFLEPGPLAIADVNIDGFVTAADVESLVNLILEQQPIAEMELTKVLSFSPTNGEFGVAPTRETVARFSMPLAKDTVLSNDNFYATFGGRRLLTSVVISADRLKATLFYQEYLPSGARVRVIFDGANLRDFLGRPIAANGGTDTSALARSDFETLSYAPVSNTGVVGTVYATKKDIANQNVPLKGVIIEVVGDEERTRTTTDENGAFTLSPVPAGRFFVNVDGREVTGGFPDAGYYPFVGKAWTAVAGRMDNKAGGSGLIYLPYIEPTALKAVSMTEPTPVEFPASVLADNPELAGTELTVPANSLFSNSGARGGKVGIAPVDPTRLPEPLPPGLDLPLVITIQTDGASNFDVPVPLKLPNTPDPVTGERLAPGERSALWSFNHDIGDWEIAGPMRVTDDGQFLVTEPGVGVRQPGWHGQRPGSSGGGGGGDGDGDDGDDFTDLTDLPDSGDSDGDDADDMTDLDDGDSDTDTDTDEDMDTDEDTDEDEDADCEEEDHCEAGDIRNAVGLSAKVPTGMLSKWENALNKIPRVRAEVGAVKGETTGWTQDCCPPGDPCADPITNGKKKTDTSVQLTAEIKGKIWGPPLIHFEADLKVALVEFLLDVGVNIVFSGGVGGGFGAESDDCAGKFCAYFEFTGNLSIGLEVLIEATAEACIGWGSWAACGDFDFTVKPASIAANFKGFLKADTCEGFTGDITLDAIEFSAEFEAFGVSAVYKYKIYP